MLKIPTVAKLVIVMITIVVVMITIVVVMITIVEVMMMLNQIRKKTMMKQMKKQKQIAILMKKKY